MIKIELIYFLIIVFANAIGSLSGMGGGVLIKPLFDIINMHDVVATSMYSTIAVFSMALISSKRLKDNPGIIKKQFLISIVMASIVGGILGVYVFDLIVSKTSSLVIIKNTQIIVSIITLFLSLVISHYSLKIKINERIIYYVLTGLFLGFLSSLLGIGGGPINVAMLMLLFNKDIKASTIISLVIILSSQATKIVVLIMNGSIFKLELNFVLVCIIGATVGAILGSKLSKVLNNSKIKIVYEVVIVIVIVLNFINL